MTRIARLDASAYRIPTPQPESDGTLAWDATTMVVVEAATADGLTGLGYSYTAAAAADVVRNTLADIVVGRDTNEVALVWDGMRRAIRNVGPVGLGAAAISAVDVSLWDLRARERELPLHELLGRRRDATPVYGSGGFTSYSQRELNDEACAWVDLGITRVKMKVGMRAGASADEDVSRVHQLRAVLGPRIALYVDANGAYRPKQATEVARRFADADVSYLEEPVPWHDVRETAFVRDNVSMDVAGGEYGYLPSDFRELLVAGAVDILQADATRCLGITGFLRAADLADTFGVGFSSHTAPALHAQLGVCVPRIDHLEYFVDHVRIESQMFDGVPAIVGGEISPDPDRPGLGLTLKRDEARRWAI